MSHTGSRRGSSTGTRLPSESFSRHTEVFPDLETDGAILDVCFNWAAALYRSPAADPVEIDIRHARENVRPEDAP